jgi:hypothetical protein
MARHHATMGHEMGNAVNRKNRVMFVERIGEASVRVPHVENLIAPREREILKP